MRDTLVAVRTDGPNPRSILVLTVDLDRHEDVWTGTCFELGTSTYADTLDEMRKELGEAILLQLNEVERLGFMETYLREHGVVEIPLTVNFEDSTQPVECWGLAGVGV